MHEAFSPHWASAASWSAMAAVGEQMSAQYFLWVAASEMAHCGAAVTPAGTSAGQPLRKPHLQGGGGTPL